MARECIAVRVRLINRVISALYDEALRPFGLRISQANILSAVAHLGEARPADFSQILRIEKSTLSRDVELMKQNGWLESDPPAGGRNQTIRLTRKGRNSSTSPAVLGEGPGRGEAADRRGLGKRPSARWPRGSGSESHRPE